VVQGSTEQEPGGRDSTEDGGAISQVAWRLRSVHHGRLTAQGQRRCRREPPNVPPPRRSRAPGESDP